MPQDWVGHMQESEWGRYGVLSPAVPPYWTVIFFVVKEQISSSSYCIHGFNSTKVVCERVV